MGRGSLLIGDLGGTNARFAVADRREPGFSDALTFDCGNYDSAEDAIEGYLNRTGLPRPRVICLAVAAPVEGATARFLNNPWVVDARALRKRFPSAQVRIINDFRAIAYAVPLLDDDDVEAIGASCPRLPQNEDFTIGVIGPGTGLGVSGLIRTGGRLHALSSEGGHLGFAPESELQLAVLERLRRHFERVSDERLLSGPGVESVYRALCDIQGRRAENLDAAEIFRQAQKGGDKTAVETERLFFEALGQAAGNLALTLGARDGVYIAGGIARRYPDRLESGPFRTGFENKGRHRPLMEHIPTCLITHPNPGLLGASCLARAGEDP